MSWRPLLAVAVLSAVGAVAHFILPPRVRVETIPFASHADAASLVTASRDGPQDVLTVEDSRVALYRLVGDKAKMIWQSDLKQTLDLDLVADVNGDGLDEFCLHVRSEGPGSLIVLGPGGNVLSRLGPTRGADPQALHSQGWLKAAAVLSVAGQRKLVCAQSGRPGITREGVALFDLASGRREWFRPTNAWPGEVAVGDLNGDGRQEILVVTGPPTDRLTRGRREGLRTSVLALSDSGQLLWKRPLALEVARARVLLLQARQRSSARVLVSIENPRDSEPGIGGLVLLDGASGRKLYVAPLPLTMGAPHLLDEERRSFVVGSNDGVLWLLDDGSDVGGGLRARIATAMRAWLPQFSTSGTAPLREVRHRWYPGSGIEVWATTAVGSGPRVRVIASTASEVLALDDRLRVCGRYSVRSRTGAAAPLTVGWGGHGTWRLCGGSAPVFVANVIPLPRWTDLDYLGWLAVAALLLAGAMAPVEWRPRRSRLSRTERREFLVEYFHIRHQNFGRDRPFSLIRRYVQARLGGVDVPEDVLERACEEFRVLGADAVRRFADRAQAMKVEAQCVECIRRLVKRVEEALRTAGDAPPLDRLVRAQEALSYVDELSRECVRAYRIVAERQLCLPDVVPQAVLNAKRSTLRLNGIRLRTTTDRAGTQPVLFDPEELRELTAQLVQNAIEALEGVTNPFIQVSIEAHPVDTRWVLLRVMDNGPGIPPDRREAVFTPGGSSHVDGGFGLAYARATARAWLGDLTIEEPPDGCGALVQLHLRALLPFDDRTGLSRGVA